MTRYVLLATPYLSWLLLVACASLPPSSTPIPAHSPTPIPTHFPTPAPPLLRAPASSQIPPAPQTLTVCLADEPQSLYLYARPEAGREHILAALYDGPIDARDYQHQPVLLTKLPSVADGDAIVNMVTVLPGETVVDSLGRVVTLAAGVAINQLDGATITYGGEGALSAPQMTVTFRLKPGVLWSDGQPLTAADSIFSFEVSQSPDAYNPRRDLNERTASYHALDAATAVWTGLPGYIDPLYFTHFWTPLPQHVYAGITPAEIGDSEGANRDPVGWGAFVLKEWVRGDHLTFERNPNYFRAAEGLPRLDRVTYRIGPADPTALLADLQTGVCDLVPQNPALDASADMLIRAGDTTAAGDVRVQLVSDNTLTHLDFGITPAEDYKRAVGNDFFQDARARQAFAYCLDREGLARLIGPSSHRRGEPPATYLPASHPLRAPEAAPLPFEPARGRALLAELGWRDADGDGVLDKDSARLRLTLAGNGGGEELWEAIQRQWKMNCGIEVEVHQLTRGESEGDWPDGVIFGRRFDLAVFGWRVGSTPPCELFTTAQIPDDDNPGGANNLGYSNVAFDAACRRGLLTLDPARAAPFHAEAQRLFARDLPMLPLFFGVKIAAARRQVLGFVLDATSPTELWNIEALTIEP